MGLFSKLQNGDTVLKSLKFGNDRPGGGNSGQPYIQDPIPLNNTPASADFILRGGINAPKSAAQDVARLTKYMFNPKSPSGLLFTAKQNLLSRTSPKTETSKGLGYAGGALNNGVYSPLSTLAQAGVGFLGGHLNKQGIDPTGLLSSLSIKKYENVIKDQEKDENRLINILSNSIKNLNGVRGYDINKGQDIITYNGGPGSTLGVGKTHIRYADQRTGVSNPLFSSNEKYFLEGGLTRPNEKNIFYYGKITQGLGASIKQGLTDSEVGIREDDTFSSYYNYTNPNTTLSKINSTGRPLLGYQGYQIGKPEDKKTKRNDPNLKNVNPTPIEDKLNIIYKRQLLSPPEFNQYDFNPTWYATSNGNLLGKYSSENTLFRDYTDSDISSNGGFLWKNLNNPSKADIIHKKGYLADLDKNAGFYKKNGEIIYYNNGYNGGIAPDFRLTPRELRGLPPLHISAQNSESIEIKKYKGKGIGETSQRWINDNGNLEKNTLDRIYYNSKSVNKSSFRISNKIDNKNDLINFNITVINPTSPETSEKPLKFRAYIDNISDSYNADWASQTYMGRGEKFYKYNSFSRDISLGFTIVADSRANLNRMYEQLNTLVSSIAPTYTKNGYMAGNLHKVTIGNYIKNQYGIMSGMTLEIMDESPWNIKSQGDGKELPMYIKVSGIKFTPIHNFRPESQFNETHSFINQS
jgi:hypothetical protein